MHHRPSHSFSELCLNNYYICSQHQSVQHYLFAKRFMLLAFVFPAWTTGASFTHGRSLPEAWPGGSASAACCYHPRGFNTH